MKILKRLLFVLAIVPYYFIVGISGIIVGILWIPLGNIVIKRFNKTMDLLEWYLNRLK